MPGGDRTGPAGMGPMTGRAAGYCTGRAVPGYAGGPGGRGFGGGGRGGGGRGRRGHRNWFYATGVPGWQRASWGEAAFGAPPPVVPPGPAADPEQECDELKRQASDLTATLESIKQRIAELESRMGEPEAEGGS